MVKAREKSRRQPGTPYQKVASGAESSPVGEEALAHAVSLGYSDDELKAVPAEALLSHGCGNAASRAWLRQGEIVVDLGSGAGLDAFLAARRVGPAGRVIGVDMTLERVERANRVARKANIANVEFIHAPIERLPLGDGSVDVAISNCVLNHCADKLRAFREVFRVLKVGGRLCISDLVISGAFSEAALKDEVWGEWLGTAQAKSDYLRAIEQAGFQAVTVEGEAVFPMAERDERLKGQITSIWLTARKG